MAYLGQQLLDSLPKACGACRAWPPDPTGKLWLGSYNKYSKIRRDSLPLWARVLQALPPTALVGMGRPGRGRVVRIVAALAGDVEGRRELRCTQRAQMLASELCDDIGLARALESAFEQMFDRWLAS